MQTPKGNVLWDCLSLIDDATVEAIGALGGIAALAMSHPHMFGSMVEWSHAFGHAPIYLHADFEGWVQRPDPVITFWQGDRYDLDEGPSLYRCGGHFTGSTVLLWQQGAAGRGVLLTSDTLHVTPDRRHVGFMYSYPNYIPLSPMAVDQVVDTVMPLAFDRIYSHFYHLVIEADAKEAVRRSAERYKQAIGPRGEPSIHSILRLSSPPCGRADLAHSRTVVLAPDGRACELIVVATSTASYRNYSVDELPGHTSSCRYF